MDADSLVKAFIPHDTMIWVAVEVLKEDPPGVYEVEITDPDFTPTPQDPIRRTVDIKHYPFLTSLPLQNEIGDTGVPDMTSLNYLHEASILDNLRRRFYSYLPYTYTGDVCVALNPYKWLPIYTDELQEKYVGKLRHELEPHVYATSAAAFNGLKNYNHNQTILASGESGAGKTETVKILMRHIAHISNNKHNTTIEKVLKANPLMESFGNAKTARNDNSSRFGKFTQLQFDPLYLLSGSKCVTYLLEKSRVVQQAPAERNYHIFHQVFAAPEDVKFTLHMAGLTSNDFLYTNEGDTVTDTIEGETDGFRFLQTLELLELLGVNEQKRDEIIRIIAGILYLGQVYFQGDADTSAIDPQYAENASICCELLGLDEKDFYEKTTSRKIEAEGHEMSIILSLEQAFDSRDALAKDIYDKLFLWLVKVINASTSATTHPSPAAHHSIMSPMFHPQEKLISLLDIFGFETFEVNHFEQLCINFANEKLQQKFTQDVFELVQNEYKEEGLEWESIDCKAVDNSEVLDLMEGKMGILALLNEECLIPKGNDTNFLSKITHSCKQSNCFSCSVHSHRDEFCVQHYAGGVFYSVQGFVERNRDALPSEISALMRTSTNGVLQDCFNVTNGAGAGAGGDTPFGNADDDFSPVTPSAAPARTGPRLAHTKSAYGSNNRSMKRATGFVAAESVTTKFRNQLDQLMREIATTTVRYVRCIKPNAIKSSLVFTRSMVTAQLRCAGLIEAIRISRSAYPYRVTHGDFLARFGKLRPKILPKMRTQLPAEQCATLLSDIWPNQFYLGPKKAASTASTSKAASKRNNGNNRNDLLALSNNRAAEDLGGSNKAYELGRTKVYFSSGVLETLERIRGSMMFTHISSIQKVWRGQKVRKWYLRQRRAAIEIEKIMRRVVYRGRYLRLRSAIISLQTFGRRRVAITKVKQLRIFTRASQIQAFVRMLPVRREYKRMRVASIVIGAIMKMKVLRKRYLIRIAKVREDAQLTKRLNDAHDRLAQIELEKQELLDKQESEARRLQEELQLQAQQQQELLQRQMQERLEAETAEIARLAEEASIAREQQQQQQAQSLLEQLESQKNDELKSLQDRLEAQLEAERERAHMELEAAKSAAGLQQAEVEAALGQSERVQRTQQEEFEALKRQLNGEKDALAQQLADNERSQRELQQRQEEEIEQLKAQLATEVTALKAELAEEKQQLIYVRDTELKDARNTAEAEKLALQAQAAADLEACTKALEEQHAQALREQLAQQAEAMTQEHDTENEKLRAEWMALLAEKDAEIAALKQAHEEAIRALNADHADELARALNEASDAAATARADEVSALNDAHQAEIAQLLAENAAELQQMEKEHDESTRALQSEKSAYFEHKEQERHELQDEHEAELEELKTALEAKIAALVTTHADNVAALAETHKAEMETLVAAKESEMEALKQAHDEAFNALKGAHEAHIAEQLHAKANELQDLEAAHAEAIQALQAEKNAYFEHKEQERHALQDEHDAEIEALKSAMEAETAALMAAHAENVSSLTKAHEANMDKLLAEKNEEIEALRTQHEEEARAVAAEKNAYWLHKEEETRQLQDSFDQELEETKAELNARREADIAALKAQFDAKLLDLENELLKQRTRMEEDTKRLLGVMDDESKEQIDTLTQALRGQFEADKARLEAQQQAALEDLRSELQRAKDEEIKALTTAHADTIAALKQEKEDALHAVREVMESQVQAHKEHGDAALLELRQRVSEHEAQVIAEKENELNELTAQLQLQKQEELEALMAQHAALVEELNARKQIELRELEEFKQNEKKVELEQLRHLMENEQIRQLHELRDQVQHQHEEYLRQRVAQHAQELAQQQEQFEQVLVAHQAAAAAAASAQREAQKEASEAEAAQRMSSVATETKVELEALQQTLTEAFEAEKALLEADKIAQVQALEKLLAEATASHDTTTEALKLQLAEALQKNEADISDLQARHAETLQQQAADFENRLLAVEADLQAQLQAQQETASRELSNAKSEQAALVEAMKAEHASRLEDELNRQQAQLKAIEAAAASAAAANDNSNSLKRDFVKRLMDVEADKLNQLAAMQEKYEAELQRLQAEHEVEKNDLLDAVEILQRGKLSDGAAQENLMAAQQVEQDLRSELLRAAALLQQQQQKQQQLGDDYRVDKEKQTAIAEAALAAKEAQLQHALAEKAHAVADRDFQACKYEELIDDLKKQLAHTSNSLSLVAAAAASASTATGSGSVRGDGDAMSIATTDMAPTEAATGALSPLSTIVIDAVEQVEGEEEDEDTAQLKSLLQTSLAKGQLLAETVIQLQQRNEFLMKEYTHVCLHQYRQNNGTSPGISAIQTTSSPIVAPVSVEAATTAATRFRSSSGDATNNSDNDNDSPLPSPLQSLNRLSVHTTRDMSFFGISTVSTTTSTTTITSAKKQTQQQRVSAEHRAEVLAAKATSVEEKKKLLMLLQHHRDEIASRVAHQGVDVADPTSAARLMRRQEKERQLRSHMSQ